MAGTVPKQIPLVLARHQTPHECGPDVDLIFNATNGNLKAEIHRQKVQYAQKVQECQPLRSELNRIKLITTTLGMLPGSESPTHESRHQSSPLPPSTLPTPSATYRISSPSLSRFGSPHMRSASMSSRPTTPASTRSQTSYTLHLIPNSICSIPNSIHPFTYSVDPLGDSGATTTDIAAPAGAP